MALTIESAAFQLNGNPAEAYANEPTASSAAATSFPE